VELSRACVCVLSHGPHYHDFNGGVSSPYGSELNPFDQPFGGRPAMTSSQQDVRPAPPRSGPDNYVPVDSSTGGGVRMPYPDDRLSDAANPLDERFSEAESSLIGYGNPRYTGAPWRPADYVGLPYDRGKSTMQHACVCRSCCLFDVPESNNPHIISCYLTRLLPMSSMLIIQ